MTVPVSAPVSAVTRPMSWSRWTTEWCRPRELPRRPQPRRAALVEDLAAATQDGRDDRRVTRQATHRLRRDQGTTLRGSHHGGSPDPRRQIVVRHRQHQRGLHPGRWPVAGAGRSAAYLHQCLTATGLGATSVAFPVRARDRRRQWPDRGFESCGPDGVEDQLIGEGTQLVGGWSRERDQPFGGVGVGLELTVGTMRGQ